MAGGEQSCLTGSEKFMIQYAVERSNSKKLLEEFIIKERPFIFVQKDAKINLRRKLKN